MKKHKIFSNLVESQKNSYSLVMTSILIAVGVNLLSTGIVELLGLQYKAAILIGLGILLSLGVIIKITWKKLKELNKTEKFKGFIIYDEDNHKIINVPKYGISTDIVRYLNSAFSENKAIEKIWNEESISEFRILKDHPGHRATGNATQSGALLIEMLEYCLIEKLSLHLSSYFNNSNEITKVHEFQKSDIPQVLLSNRFLRLFSEDMVNREIFACQNNLNGKASDNSHIVCAFTSSGGYYHKFELILPENSHVIRNSKNKIVIETPILTLTLTYLFGGFNTVLSPGFHKYYLGLITEHQGSLHDYEFNVEVSVKFKLRSLFSKDKEIYYSWIDSFLDEVAEYIGTEEFFNRINWNTIYTMILCNKNITLMRESSIKNEKELHIPQPSQTTD